MSKVIEQSSLKENLQRLLDASGLRASDLADYTQLPASTIKYILSGNTYNPRVETLFSIADYFNITIDELYRNKDCIAAPSVLKPAKVPPSQENSYSIPILDWKDIKNWFSPQVETRAQERWLHVGRPLHSTAFALTIESEGKVVFPKNSTILVEPQENYTEDDYVIVSINKNIPTLRKIFEDSGTAYLRSVAALLPPEQLAPPHLVWGKVIECRIGY